MCGRYFIDDETSKEIKKILQRLTKKVPAVNSDAGISALPTGRLS